MLFKKNNKGQMGLNLLLSVISILFVIGIIVMAFVLVAESIAETDIMYDQDSTGSATNETVTSVIEGDPQNVSVSGLRNVVCTIGQIYNNTALIPASNYTTSNCEITYDAGETTHNNTDWSVSYTYVYDELRTDAEGVLNDTRDAMGESTSFFSIIIIIASVVVLILLIVVIINSLRQSGLIGNGGA